MVSVSSSLPKSSCFLSHLKETYTPFAPETGISLRGVEVPETTNNLVVDSTSGFIVVDNLGGIRGSYRPSKMGNESFSLPDTATVDYVDFIKDYEKEVGRLPRRARRFLRRRLLQVSAIAVPTMVWGTVGSPKASASGIDMIMPFLQQRTSETPVSVNSYYSNPNQYSVLQNEKATVSGNVMDQIDEMGLISSEILNILVDIIVTCGIVGVLLAMLCLMAAGGFRMMGQLERARTWSANVVKGLGQILIAPVMILLLTLLTSKLLGGIDGLDVFY